MNEDSGSGISELEVGEHIDDSSFNAPDVADTLRNHASDLFKTISGIEEVIDSLVEVFDAKVQTFTHEKTILSFSGMSVFSENTLLSNDADKILLIQINDDNESLIGCFRMHQDVVRFLLAITLGGANAQASEFGQDKLRSSEIRLLKLFVDHLMSGFLECVDVDASFGIPRTPTIADNDVFFSLAQDTELVSFDFDFSLGDNTNSFELVIPLQIFEKDDSKVAGKQELEKAKQEERIWSEQLYKRVEIVDVPLLLEIANCEMPLTRLASLNVGERFDINLDLNHVKILDESGAQTFMGDLKINADEISLRVTGALLDKGA